MKKFLAILILACLLLAGCEAMRLPPSETQKQNAWLHNRTAMMAAGAARSENSSEKLQALTHLSELQSSGLTSYFGLPKQFPPAETAEDILRQSNFQLAQTALDESAKRPDAFALADNVFDLAIGISALLGGVYGTRAVRFLKQARDKSNALQEIIVGNELFKKEHKEYAVAFKQAHRDQAPRTQQIVAEMKTS